MRNRVAAALIAFFFGGFGIHKFYLGQTISGIIYLLFFWTLIPSIIAFFEFLILLFMSDRAFDAQFNYNYITSGHNSHYPQHSYLQESSKDKAMTLMELKKLYDNNIITAEEYEEKRRKILDSI
jgi:TM2 domain-containing membrane protein YozV